MTVGRLSSSVCKFDEGKSRDGGESLACKLVLNRGQIAARIAWLESMSEHLTAESSLLLLHNHHKTPQTRTSFRGNAL